MTHEYTILTGGLVLPGGGSPACTAIAWADETVLAIGRDVDVRAISHGDSRFVDLRGAVVVPLPAGGAVRWPTDATLEIGGRADLAILETDPRLPAVADLEGAAGPSRPGGSRAIRTLAVIRSGRLVEGALPAGSPTERRTRS